MRLPISFTSTHPPDLLSEIDQNMLGHSRFPGCLTIKRLPPVILVLRLLSRLIYFQRPLPERKFPVPICSPIHFLPVQRFSREFLVVFCASQLPLSLDGQEKDVRKVNLRDCLTVFFLDLDRSQKVLCLMPVPSGA
jgi:hypothetical protein